MRHKYVHGTINSEPLCDAAEINANATSNLDPIVWKKLNMARITIVWAQLVLRARQQA